MRRISRAVLVQPYLLHLVGSTPTCHCRRTHGRHHGRRRRAARRTMDGDGGLAGGEVPIDQMVATHPTAVAGYDRRAQGDDPKARNTMATSRTRATRWDQEIDDGERHGQRFGQAVTIGATSVTAVITPATTRPMVRQATTIDGRGRRTPTRPRACAVARPTAVADPATR